MDAMSGEPEYKIVAAPFDSALFEHVRKIRIDVFVHEQGYPLEDEMDEYDSETFHLLLLHRSPTASADFPELGGYEPAGTLRYFPPPKNKVGRVAVSKHFRGKGLGGVMMKGLESILRGDFVDAPNFPGGKATEISMHAQGRSRLLNFECASSSRTKPFFSTSPSRALLQKSGLRYRGR